MIYVFLSYEGLSFPIAQRMQDDGVRVLVGQVQDASEIGDSPEKPNDRQRRLQLYDGILDKQPAKKLLKTLANAPDKDEYVIFCDFNTLWRQAEYLLSVGFTQGLFPTEEDRHFEKDRKAAREFVQQHYPDLSVLETIECKTIKDAQQALKTPKGVYVLKSNSGDGETVVPRDRSLHKAAQQILDMLAHDRKAYESQGFTLEQRLVDPLEYTPQMVWLDGRPVYAIVDLETKLLGAGDIGPQVGCAQNLVVLVDCDADLLRMAFPSVVHAEAKRRFGWYWWDASILYDEEERRYYFGEFCANRPGYDSLMCEIDMAGGPRAYFEAMLVGTPPLAYQYGAGVRLFNMSHGGTTHLENKRILAKNEGKDGQSMWLYDAMQERGHYRTTGYSWDLGMAGGVADLPSVAIDRAYQAARERVSVNDLYYRPQSDFLSTEYPTAILNRLERLHHEGLLDMPQRSTQIKHQNTEQQEAA